MRRNGGGLRCSSRPAGCTASRRIGATRQACPGIARSDRKLMQAAACSCAEAHAGSTRALPSSSLMHAGELAQGAGVGAGAHLLWEAGTMAPPGPDLMVHSCGRLLAGSCASSPGCAGSSHTGRSTGCPSRPRALASSQGPPAHAGAPSSSCATAACRVSPGPRLQAAACLTQSAGGWTAAASPTHGRHAVRSRELFTQVLKAPVLLAVCCPSLSSWSRASRAIHSRPAAVTWQVPATPAVSAADPGPPGVQLVQPQEQAGAGQAQRAQQAPHGRHALGGARVVAPQRVCDVAGRCLAPVPAQHSSASSCAAAPGGWETTAAFHPRGPVWVLGKPAAWRTPCRSAVRAHAHGRMQASPGPALGVRPKPGTHLGAKLPSFLMRAA